MESTFCLPGKDFTVSPTLRVGHSDSCPLQAAQISIEHPISNVVNIPAELKDDDWDSNQSNDDALVFIIRDGTSNFVGILGSMDVIPALG